MRVPNLIAAGCLMTPALIASAYAAPVEGVVVSVSETEVVLDVGRDRGLQPNTPLRLFRRLVVTHPITKETIEDRFPIGTVVPAEVGARLTIVRSWSKLSRPPAAGDFVVLGVDDQPAKVRAKVEAQCKPAGRKAADIVALEALLMRSLGESPERRVQAYRAFTVRYPQSHHVPAVQAEIAALQRAVVPVAALPPPLEAPKVVHLTARSVRAGQPLTLAVGLPNNDAVEAVRVVAYRHAELPWQTFEMKPDGDAYYRVTLPASFMERAGVLGYVIEVVRDDQVWEAVANSTKPVKVKVLAPPPEDRPPGASRFEVFGRMVDFNTAGDAVDAYFQFESAFSYVIGHDLLRSVRVGIGLLDGEGGETEAIDLGGATRTFSLNYAFAEAELSLSRWAGVTGRLTTGSHHQTDDGSASTLTGVEGRVRVGLVDETRIEVGASALDVLGAQGFINLFVEVVPDVPIRAGAVVTNLPVDGDLGVQLEGQVGYRVSNLLTVHALAGWNARTINHYGFTGGGGLTLDW
jgi:hypothetical protein